MKILINVIKGILGDENKAQKITKKLLNVVEQSGIGINEDAIIAVIVRVDRIRFVMKCGIVIDVIAKEVNRTIGTGKTIIANVVVYIGDILKEKVVEVPMLSEQKVRILKLIERM